MFLFLYIYQNTYFLRVRERAESFSPMPGIPSFGFNNPYGNNDPYGDPYGIMQITQNSPGFGGGGYGGGGGGYGFGGGYGMGGGGGFTDPNFGTVWGQEGGYMAGYYGQRSFLEGTGTSESVMNTQLGISNLMQRVLNAPPAHLTGMQQPLAMDGTSVTNLLGSIDLDGDKKISKEELDKAIATGQANEANVYQQASQSVYGWYPNADAVPKYQRDMAILNQLKTITDAKGTFDLADISKLLGADGVSGSLTSADVTTYLAGLNVTPPDPNPTPVTFSQNVNAEVDNLFNFRSYNVATAGDVDRFKADMNAVINDTSASADKKALAKFLLDNVDKIKDFATSSNNGIINDNLVKTLAQQDTTDGADILSNKDIAKIVAVAQQTNDANKFEVSIIQDAFKNASGTSVTFTSPEQLQQHIDTVLTERLNAETDATAKAKIQKQIDAMKFIKTNFAKLNTDGGTTLSVEEVVKFAETTKTDKPTGVTEEVLSQDDINNYKAPTVPTTAAEIVAAMGALSLTKEANTLDAVKFALLDANNPLLADQNRDGVITQTEIEQAHTRITEAIAKINADPKFATDNKYQDTYILLSKLKSSLEQIVGTDGKVDTNKFNTLKALSFKADGFTFEGLANVAKTKEKMTNSTDNTAQTTFSEEDWTEANGLAAKWLALANNRKEIGHEEPTDYGGSNFVVDYTVTVPSYTQNFSWSTQVFDAFKNDLVNGLTEDQLKERLQDANVSQAHKDVYALLYLNFDLLKDSNGKITKTTLDAVRNADGNSDTLSAQEIYLYNLYKKP